ncbi:MAG: RluA family pseudouridine synthase [Candidatus Binatia bacterium]
MKEGPPDQDLPCVTFWVVEPGNAGARLDACLRRLLPHVSLRELKKALAEGAFQVNQKKRKKGYVVRAGELISFHGPNVVLAQEPLPRHSTNVRIVYEDEAILVVDKPAGMATHGFSARETDSLTNHLVAIRPELRNIGKSLWEPGLVHRLDRETSGLVLVAKEQETFSDLRAQFRSQRVHKKYWALLRGDTPKQGSIDYPIIHDPKNRRKMKALVDPAAHRGQKRWRAVTRYRTLAQDHGFSLVEVEMLTGVTHQIRAHFVTLGNPLVGDSLYGPGHSLSPPLKRHFLHAFYLGCRHPKSGAAVAWQSPMPHDLREVLAALQLSFNSQLP